MSELSLNLLNEKELRYLQSLAIEEIEQGQAELEGINEELRKRGLKL